MSDKLTASEAVYGFSSWLSCRAEKVSFGSTSDCGVLADLVNEFNSTNDLEPPREGWENNLIHPKNVRGGSCSSDQPAD